jgi:hypothetical protein
MATRAAANACGELEVLFGRGAASLDGAVDGVVAPGTGAGGGSGGTSWNDAPRAASVAATSTRPKPTPPIA